MVDDNQIYKLQIELKDDGFFRVLGLELRDWFAMRRLVPLYSVQEIIQAQLLGGNLVAWSLAMGLVGGCAAGLLYCFFRLCHGTLLASLAFALITVVGEQSVVWWRMLHGEGIGMLMLSAALVLMAWGVRTGKRRYEVAFVCFTTLATLSKESFILTIPAMLILKVWLTAREQQTTVSVAARQSWLSIVWLSVVFAAELSIIKFVFATTSFNYAGWKGFDAGKFQNVVVQYAQISNIWLLGILVFFAFVVWMFRREPEDGRKMPRSGYPLPSTSHNM